jgi:uncharacterized protein YggL (DUF469 family)
MIVKPIEEFETARYKKYQKDILELGAEFQEWAKGMMVKYLSQMTEEQRDKMMHRFSDDARYLISVDVAKLLGKE